MAVSNYYVARKKRLLKEFDLYAEYSRSALLKYFGAEHLDEKIARAKQEFERLIPQLPYIGGRQPFTQFIVATGLSLALYRTAKANGKTVEEVGQLLFEIGQAILQGYPLFIARLFGKMNFSSFYLKRLEKRAMESHRRKYPEDYLYDFVPGDGSTFDYGVDYLECASCKFLAKQGAPELAPYLCPIDVLYSRALGWGLMRTMTLAEGAEKCDFRFKQGRPTNIAVPPALRELVHPS